MFIHDSVQLRPQAPAIRWNPSSKCHSLAEQVCAWSGVLAFAVSSALMFGLLASYFVESIAHYGTADVVRGLGGM